MEILLILSTLVTVFCSWLGYKMVKRGLRESKAPPVPPARIANPDGAEKVYAKATRIATRAPRKTGKGLLVVAGVGLILAPWAAAIAAIAALRDLANMDFTKGRVLRIRNRAQLPEPAHGDGWCASEVTVNVELPPAER